MDVYTLLTLLYSTHLQPVASNLLVTVLMLESHSLEAATVVAHAQTITGVITLTIQP